MSTSGKACPSDAFEATTAAPTAAAPTTATPTTTEAAAEYSETKDGVSSCPNGFGKITDEAMCLKAGASLPSRKTWAKSGSWAHIQPGCISKSKGLLIPKLFFNSISTGTPHRDFSSVCAAPTTVAPTTTQACPNSNGITGYEYHEGDQYRVDPRTRVIAHGKTDTNQECADKCTAYTPRSTHEIHRNEGCVAFIRDSHKNCNVYTATGAVKYRDYSRAYTKCPQAALLEIEAYKNEKSVEDDEKGSDQGSMAQ